MGKTASFNLNLDANLAESAEALYNALGLSLATAIELFLNKSIMERGLPFDLRMPPLDDDMLREARGILNGTVPTKAYRSAQEMIDSVLGEEDDDA